MATRWWGSTLPASDARAPFGIRIASTGVCSNESGIDSSRIRMALRERVYASEARDGSADLQVRHGGPEGPHYDGFRRFGQVFRTRG